MEESEKLRLRARRYRAMARTSAPTLRDTRMRLATYLEVLADKLEDDAEEADTNGGKADMTRTWRHAGF